MTTLELFDFGENFKAWIKIILGMQEGTNFNAVTVVNGNISKPFEVQRCCRPGDLIIMAIEILALMLKHLKCQPYKTRNGTSHLLDICAEDLTIYLGMKRNQNMKNLRNISEVMRILEVFQKWSGLCVNKSKTHTSIFGMSLGKPRYIEQLGIEWCTDFELLGIMFDQTLSRMDINYENCFKSMQDELNS